MHAVELRLFASGEPAEVGLRLIDSGRYQLFSGIPYPSNDLLRLGLGERQGFLKGATDDGS
jgi:hypothetical protein